MYSTDALLLAVAMEIELEVETQLSQRLALEANDATALTKAQQETLDRHKVRQNSPSATTGH